MKRVREECGVGCCVGWKVKGPEVVYDEASGIGGELCSGEVRVEGEAAKVGGDGGVGSRREKEINGG